MNKDILVFVAKDEGARLLEYIVSNGYPVVRVIVGRPEDIGFARKCLPKDVPVNIYDAKTESLLSNERKHYSWLLNLWCPYILSKKILSLADHRLNIHPGLVPICRGNDNAAWTIRKNLPAGVSLIEMTERIDEGAVYVQKAVEYQFPIKGKDLNIILKAEAEKLFIENWPAIYSETIQPVPQQGNFLCHTRQQTNNDRVLESSTILTVGDFLRWILAHDFSPKTTAEVKDAGRRFKVTLNIEEIN